MTRVRVLADRVRQLHELVKHQVDIGLTPAASSVSAPGDRRWLSKVPEEYQGYYSGHSAQKTSAPRPQTSATEAQPSASTAQPSASTAQPSSATPTRVWMFPWEKRQIEGAGTPLRTWEKAYWGIFVSAIAIFLFSRTHSSPAKTEDPQVAQQKEENKMSAARALLAGRSFNEGDDLFDGLTPQEIQEYVAKATKGATSQDPFEGLSPDEINEYLARQNSQPP